MEIIQKSSTFQKAIEEIISTELSYLQSLDILINHYQKSIFFEYQSSNIKKHQNNVIKHNIFSGINAIYQVSKRFHEELQLSINNSINICKIIINYCMADFKVYVSYCSTKSFQDKALEEIMKCHEFKEELDNLSKDPLSKNLAIASYLLLPLQRITRIPLLVESLIVNIPTDDPNLKKYVIRAKEAAKEIVLKCNESARTVENYEAIIRLEKMLVLKSKTLALIKPDRFFLLEGKLITYKSDKIFYIHLFNDLIIISKTKWDGKYEVDDMASRVFVRAYSKNTSNDNYILTIIILRGLKPNNSVYLFQISSSKEINKWMEELSPKIEDEPGCTRYFRWEAPRYICTLNYDSSEPDEITLNENDLIDVYRQTDEGLMYGLNVNSNKKGWFPLSNVIEVESERSVAIKLWKMYERKFVEYI